MPIYSCFILVYLTVLQLDVSINLSLWQLLIIIYLSQSHSLTVFNHHLYQSQTACYLCQAHSHSLLYLCLSPSLTALYLDLSIWMLFISVNLILSSYFSWPISPDTGSSVSESPSRSARVGLTWLGAMLPPSRVSWLSLLMWSLPRGIGPSGKENLCNMNYTSLLPISMQKLYIYTIFIY